MQVCKAFFKNVKRQIKSLTIYLVIFMVLSIAFSKMGQQQEDTIFHQTKIKIAVIDRDQSVLSTGLYDYLAEVQRVIEIADDKVMMADELYYNTVEYIVIITEGFEEKILSGDKSAVLESIRIPQSTSAEYVDQDVNQVLDLLYTYAAAGYMPEEIVTKTLETKNQTINVTKVLTKNTDSVSGLYYYFAYVPYILLCILVIGLGTILSNFRKKEIDARMRCSALSLRKRNTALILSSVVFSLLCWFAFMILGVALRGKDFIGEAGILYIGNSLAFLFVALGITYLFSFLFTDESTLNMASNVTGLGMSFLGGIFVPMEFMGESVQRIAKFLPTYWYIRNAEQIEDLTVSADHLRPYFNNIAMQLLFGAVFLSIALAVSTYGKRRA